MTDVSPPYAEEPAPSPAPAPERSAGPWRVLGVLMAILNFALGFLAGAGDSRETGYLLGSAVGAAILWPGIAVLLFRISKRFRNTRSSWKIFFWVSLIVMLSLFGRIGQAVGGGASGSASLERIAAAQNRELPKMIDEDTELFNVEAGNGKLTFNYRLVNTSAAQIDPILFIGEMSPIVTRGACDTAAVREFLSRGVSLSYAYHDKNNTQIGLPITVTEATCN